MGTGCHEHKFSRKTFHAEKLSFSFLEMTPNVWKILGKISDQLRLLISLISSRLLFFPFSTMKTHPGSVVHLSDNPLDSNKVNILVLASHGDFPIGDGRFAFMLGEIAGSD